MTTTILDHTERRQVGKTLTFPPDMVPFINWQTLADTRRDLASDLHVTVNADDSLTVVFSWHYEGEEKQS
jgi:hypothetical protein